ncbi:MAG: hypothetical protein J6V66_03245, partial [Clostridia bacterium]|nr:hypothetical protein [Clostridia bacterium]
KWSMKYENYELEGIVDASEVDYYTDSLSYDISESTVSTSASVNSNLKKLAALACKQCLIALETYFIESDLDVSIKDIGFNYDI